MASVKMTVTPLQWMPPLLHQKLLNGEPPVAKVYSLNLLFTHPDSQPCCISSPSGREKREACSVEKKLWRGSECITSLLSAVPLACIHLNNCTMTLRKTQTGAWAGSSLCLVSWQLAQSCPLLKHIPLKINSLPQCVLFQLDP